MRIVFGALVSLAMTTACVDSGPVAVHYGLWTGRGEAQHIGALKFKEIVEAGSQGKFEVILHLSNQLGTPTEMLAQLALDVTQVMASGDPGLVDIEYLSLPYLMRGMGNYEFILNGPIGEEWNRTLADTRHVRLLGLLPRSARQISANRIVRSMADLEGLRLRVPKRDYYIQSVAAFGARPTPMAFAEIYMGLQTGVVDGLENPIETLYAQRFYEVQKSILMIDYIMKPAYVMIGAPFWRSLSEPEQTLFHSAAVAARDVVVELLPEQERVFLAEMEAAGIVVTYPDKREFVAATRQVREDLGKERWGAELYQTIYEIGQRVF